MNGHTCDPHPLYIHIYNVVFFVVAVVVVCWYVLYLIRLQFLIVIDYREEYKRSPDRLSSNNFLIVLMLLKLRHRQSATQ